MSIKINFGDLQSNPKIVARDEALKGSPKQIHKVEIEKPTKQAQAPVSQASRAAREAVEAARQRSQNRFTPAPEIKPEERPDLTEAPMAEQPTPAAARTTGALRDIVAQETNKPQELAAKVETKTPEVRSLDVRSGELFSGSPINMSKDQANEIDFHEQDKPVTTQEATDPIAASFVDEPGTLVAAAGKPMQQAPASDKPRRRYQTRRPRATDFTRIPQVTTPVTEDMRTEADALSREEQEQRTQVEDAQPYSPEEFKANLDEPRTNRQKSMETSWGRIINNIKKGYFPIKGSREVIDDKGIVHTSFPAEVQEELSNTLAQFGYAPYSSGAYHKYLFAGFQLYLSMNVDRKGKIFKQNADDVEISSRQFIHYLQEIRENAKNFGDPFYYSHPESTFAGKRRFPNLMTDEVIDFFVRNQTPANILNGVSRYDLKTRNKQNWEQRVLPELKHQAVDQREAVLDITRAVQIMNKEVAPEQILSESTTLKDLLNLENRIIEDPEVQEALAETFKQTTEQRLRALEWKRKREQFGHRREGVTFGNSNKNIDDATTDIANAGSPYMIDRMFDGIKNFGIVAGVVLRVQLAGTAVLEAAQGTAIREVNTAIKSGVHRASALVRSNNEHISTRVFQDSENLRPSTKALLEQVSPEVVNEVMGALGILDQNPNGFYEIVNQIDEGGSLAELNLLQKMQQQKNSRKEIEGAGSRLEQNLKDKAELMMDITTGEYAFRETRTRLWLKETLLNLAKTQEISPRAVAESMTVDPQGTIHTLLKLDAGKQALAYVSNATIGGIDPVINFMMIMGAKYPRLEFLVRASTTWYWRYGYSATKRLIPFSNTALYLAKSGLDVGKKKLGQDEATIRDSRQYLYGGTDSFQKGLAMNFGLDVVQFGGTALAATLVCSVIIAAAGGIEPPDDDELKHLWYEWKIGGVAIKESWYSNDLFGVGMPAAIAMIAGAQTDDNHLAGQILANGMTDKLWSGAPLGNVADIFDMFNNFNRNYVEAQIRSEGNVEEGSLQMDNFFFTQLGGLMIRRGIAIFEPAVVRDFYNNFGIFRQGEAAKSKNVVWNSNTKNDNDPDTLTDVVQTTYADSELRRNVYNSPFAGMVANILTGAGFGDDTNARKTGYMRYQMPDISRVDETQKSLADLLKVFDANGEEVPIDQWTKENQAKIINQTIDIVASGDPAWLAQQGYVIPYDARVSASLYLKERQQLLWSLVYRKKEIKNYFSDDYYENDRMITDEFARTQKEVARLKALERNLWSDELPYSPTKYGRWETDYRTRYYYKNSGEPANPIAAVFDTVFKGGKEIGVELYASGDNRSPLTPWQSVQNPWNSYNAETPVAWQGKLTDYDAIEKRDKDVTILNGSNAGKNLWDIETGGNGKSMQEGQSWDPTLVFPERGHFAKEQAFIKKPTSDEFATLASKYGFVIQQGDSTGKLNTANLSKLNVDLQAEYDDLESAENKTSRGWSSSWRNYGGSSGWKSYGSSYTPIIYSHPAYSLNVDKPQGYYSQTPYRTNFDYLRPSVETKGSREAYRREDI